MTLRLAAAAALLFATVACGGGHAAPATAGLKASTTTEPAIMVRHSHDHAGEHPRHRIAVPRDDAEDGSSGIDNVKPAQYTLTVYAGPVPVVRSIDVKSAQTDLGLIQ